MARNASPWYWERRNCWAVIIDGQRHILGEHVDPTPPHKRKNKWVVPSSIRFLFDALKVSLRSDPKPSSFDPEPERIPVAEIFEKFRDWCSKNRSPRTYEWSRNHIQSFVNSLKARGISTAAFPAEDLRPFHVNEWVDAFKVAKGGRRPWGPNHCRGAIIAVQRAFTWAEKQGHISKSPIRHIEKPPPKRREQVLTQDDFDSLLMHVSDEPFRDVLEFCWETGCRVQEVRLLEAVHYKPDRGRFELPPQQAKGKKRWRLIYLTPQATQIVERLLSRHPEGPLFRNADSNRNQPRERRDDVRCRHTPVYRRWKVPHHGIGLR